MASKSAPFGGKKAAPFTAASKPGGKRRRKKSSPKTAKGTMKKTGY